jgi:hypothetical protein
LPKSVPHPKLHVAPPNLQIPHLSEPLLPSEPALPETAKHAFTVHLEHLGGRVLAPGPDALELRPLPAQRQSLQPLLHQEYRIIRRLFGHGLS